MHRGCSLTHQGVAACDARGCSLRWTDGRGSSGRGVLSAAKSHASHKGWWCMGGSAGHEAGARSQLARVRVRARVRVSVRVRVRVSLQG